MTKEVAYTDVLAVMMRLPVVCRESRRMHGWSRRELALRAGVAPSVVARLEDGAEATVSLRNATYILGALLKVVNERED